MRTRRIIRLERASGFCIHTPFCIPAYTAAHETSMTCIHRMHPHAVLHPPAPVSTVLFLGKIANCPTCASAQGSGVLPSALGSAKEEHAPHGVPLGALRGFGAKKALRACALQGIAARWLSAHYKTIARSIARAMARGLGFVTPCPNKQGKNAYFSKVSDASGTACDAVNVREDCKHFGPPLWVVPVEERGPFGGPS